ncbi:MAG: hypothetical protein ACI9J3_000402 [Parvicellaceae bacterium]|jgi:hypothetical protein
MRFNFLAAAFSTLLFISLVLTSCKKQEPATITIAGTITETNGTAISGADIKMSVKEISGGTFSSTFNTFYNGPSASNGSYSHTFDAHNAVEYKIEITGDNRFDQEFIINPDDLERNAANTYDFSLIAQAWYKVNIRNTSPFDSTDFMQYQIASTQLNCPGCCHNLIQVFSGDLVDSTFKCMTTGNSMLKVNWYVTKNSIPSSYSDSVYCAIGDTGILNVNY